MMIRMWPAIFHFLLPQPRMADLSITVPILILAAVPRWPSPHPLIGTRYDSDDLFLLKGTRLHLTSHLCPHTFKDCPQICTIHLYHTLNYLILNYDRLLSLAVRSTEKRSGQRSTFPRLPQGSFQNNTRPSRLQSPISFYAPRLPRAACCHHLPPLTLVMRWCHLNWALALPTSD